MRRNSIISLLIPLIILLSGRLTPVAAQDNAQIVVYLEGADNIDRRIELDVDRVILNGNIESTELTPETDKIISTDLTGKQLLFLEQTIPPGIYSSLTIFFKSIKAFAGDADIYPAVDSSGLTLPINADIPNNSAHTVLLFWNPSRFEYDSVSYRPDFKIINKELPPIGAALFVSNAGSGNISVIDRYSKKVVDVIKSGPNPGDMALSPSGDQLYVLDSGVQTIEVFEVLRMQLEKKIQLPFHDRPSRLLLMPDNLSLYILLPGSQTVALYNAFSMQETDRFELKRSPSSFALDSYSGTIYISDSYSSELVKINPQMRPSQVSLSIPTAMQEIVIDSRGNQIFGAHATNGTISVLNAQTGASLRSIKICSPANSLVYDDLSQTLFAAMEDCQEIAVIKPNSGIEIGSIRLSSRPGRIFLDKQTRNLLITLPDKQQVAFCNVTTNKISAVVSVGKQPTAIMTP